MSFSQQEKNPHLVFYWMFVVAIVEGVHTDVVTEQQQCRAADSFGFLDGIKLEKIPLQVEDREV